MEERDRDSKERELEFVQQQHLLKDMATAQKVADFKRESLETINKKLLGEARDQGKAQKVVAAHADLVHLKTKMGQGDKSKSTSGSCERAAGDRK